MSDTKKVYRSFLGFVKFEPKEQEAAGKTVRAVVIRNIGVKEQALDVRCTLWPSHDEVEVAEGDLIAVEGQFTVNKTKNKDGDPVTYFNLSVSRIRNLGEGFAGERVETTNTSRAADADETEGDDGIPY